VRSDAGRDDLREGPPMRVMPGFDISIIFASVCPCSLVMQLLRLHWRRTANAEGGVSVPVSRLVRRFLAVGIPVLFSFFSSYLLGCGKVAWT
jgi:hypothetical protein